MVCWHICVLSSCSEALFQLLVRLQVGHVSRPPSNCLRAVQIHEVFLCSNFKKQKTARGRSPIHAMLQLTPTTACHGTLCTDKNKHRLPS